MLGHALCHTLSFHSQTITHSITNNLPQSKQLIRSGNNTIRMNCGWTYCYQARSAHLTLLVLMSSTFLDPQIIRPPFSKIPNNQLSSFEKKLDNKKIRLGQRHTINVTPNNLAYPKFRTTDSTFWDLLLEISDPR